MTDRAAHYHAWETAKRIIREPGREPDRIQLNLMHHPESWPTMVVHYPHGSLGVGLTQTEAEELARALLLDAAQIQDQS